MIRLGVVERAGLGDLGGDRGVARRSELLLVHLAACIGLLELPIRRGVDRAAVLGTDVIALTVALRRIVALPKNLEQLRVADFGRVVDDEHGLGVPGAAGARLVVGGVRGESTRIADGGRVDAGRLPELALRAPKATETEHRCLIAIRPRPLQRLAVGVVDLWYRHGLLDPPRKSVLRRHHCYRLVEQHGGTPF